MINEEDRYHIERATEIMKGMYKEHIKDLPKIEQVKKAFYEKRQHPELIAKQFDIQTHEVLKLLQSDLKNRKK